MLKNQLKYKIITGKSKFIKFSIPEDWELSSIGRIGKYINGMAFRPEQWKKSGIPIIRIQNLTDESSPFNYFDKCFEKVYEIDNDDILISWSATLGVFKWNRGKAVLNQHIFKAIPNSNLNKDFFYYAISEQVEQMKSMLHGTTMKHITKQPFLDTSIPLPPLNQQQKIASILSNVDELIQKIEQIIEKTKKLKKGLMQRLFTKGIGHTQFKKTELGEIPEQWNIVEIGEITTKITDIDHKMPKKVQRGIPFVTVKYLTKDDSYYFNLIHDTYLEYILEEDYKYHSKKFNAEYGDLLISRYGTIGVTKMINTQEKLIASYSIALIKPKRDIIFPLFLTHALNSDKIKRQIQSFIEQSSNTNLDLLRIKKIKVARPNLEEQQKISSIISYIDLLVHKRRELKLELENLKKGLMQQLLTGKIRVKV